MAKLQAGSPLPFAILSNETLSRHSYGANIAVGLRGSESVALRQDTMLAAGDLRDR
ncbi:hypothetical protein [Bradyrhizobium sp. ISRA464]|uniref:hypothetical protein n=1 Tax=Bradyrhizobium sp. ISRA464 TaxID=2866200 RepID=UPI00247AB81F|nr:hypothetical protein [Bradyrhizobium sp. ISRA464]WGS26133.1 hypothetical protein MTX19_31075 [Bradyrhizobium sp. ISRA464]